jgi:DNA/RNA endonuclease G (NUC1)
MLGSADRLSSTATNKQVFYYSNIAPQYSDTFNTGGGAWNNLEDHIDDLVCSDTLYVVIGCYFDQYTDKYGNTGRPAKISYGGRSDVSRPTMFYYALLRTKSGSSGKADLGREKAARYRSFAARFLGPAGGPRAKPVTGGR